MTMKKSFVALVVCLMLMGIVTCITAWLTLSNDIAFFDSLCSVVKTNVVSIHAIVSCILGALDFAIPLITGKEASKSRSVWLGVVLFTTTYLFQCFSDIFPNALKTVGIYSIITIFIVFYIYLLCLDYKTLMSEKQTGNTPNIEASSSEVALSKYVKRKIRNCHADITSIQLHRLTKDVDSSNKNILYHIEYIDCGRKKVENLNAILDTTLEIPQKSYDCFSPFLDAFNGYLSSQSTEQQNTYIDTMEVLSKMNIESIKNELNSHIETVSDIKNTDCCLSRLILTYLSCLARIGKENAGAYAGVRCQSLNVCSQSEKADEINKQLFTMFRTGFLGGLLLKSVPYVFFYEQDDNISKNNRRYITFLLDGEQHNNSFLILVTVNHTNTTDTFHWSLAQAIESIRNECFALYQKHEVNKNG